ncbi:MAG: [Fe-S]-binding protein, partial [Chloroflexota bacterium]
MLTTVEKVLFFVLAVIALYAAYVTFGRMIRTILRGQGQITIDSKGRFVVDSLIALLNQGGIIHRRRIASLFHYAVAWGFVFYGLVNLLDVVEGYVADFHFLG